jgi:CxxC motif-containing protein (DUF1111 family)
MSAPMTGRSRGFAGRRRTSRYWLVSGEAYNVEIGITKELFLDRTKRDACVPEGTDANDTTSTDASGLDTLSDIEKFAAFMRFLTPPVASTERPGGASSISNGKQLFRRVGCAVCHTPMLRTGHAAVVVLDNKKVNLYSDLAIHNMGEGLADGISQELAKGTDFRTAPLWGLGRRMFLHDALTSDEVQAIREHRGL